MVAYKTELNVWSLEICDTKSLKKTKAFLSLPPIEDTIGIKVSEFKDEFVYPIKAITDLDGELSQVVERTLDTRKRHVFRALTWTNNPDEIVVVASDNFIFKVRT